MFTNLFAAHCCDDYIAQVIICSMIPLLVQSWVKEIDIWAFPVCVLMLSGKEGDPVLVIRLSVCIHGTLHVATYYDSCDQAGRCGIS